jgi:hypothetical protein
MTADPELEELTTKVREAFGPDALSEAYLRAIRATAQSEQVPDAPRRRRGVTSVHTQLIAALKVELRRMLGPG